MSGLARFPAQLADDEMDHHLAGFFAPRSMRCLQNIGGAGEFSNIVSAYLVSSIAPGKSNCRNATDSRR